MLDPILRGCLRGAVVGDLVMSHESQGYRFNCEPLVHKLRLNLWQLLVQGGFHLPAVVIAINTLLFV